VGVHRLRTDRVGVDRVGVDTVGVDRGVGCLRDGCCDGLVAVGREGCREDVGRDEVGLSGYARRAGPGPPS